MLLGPPITYSPIIARITKSINSAILLNQLLYWWERKTVGKDSIYKTINELKEETYLSRYFQDKSITELLEHEFIEIIVKGTPPKRHFRVNIQEIVDSITEHKSNLSMDEKLICNSSSNNNEKGSQINVQRLDKLNCEGLANKDVKALQNYTKNTTEITTKNTSKNTTNIPAELIFNQNSKEINSDNLKSSEINPPFLRSSPLNKAHNLMKNTFIDYYKNKKAIPYCWTGKDGWHLNEIIKKLRFLYKEHKKVPDDDLINENFTMILEKITDKWIIQNLSVSIINSKFNELVSNLKNQQNERDSKQGRFSISSEYERSIYERLYGKKM